MASPSVDYLSGVDHYRHGRLAEALDCFRRHLALVPDDFQGHICAGVVLEALQRSADAADHYLQAVRLHPDPVYHYTVGCVLRKLRDRGRAEDEAAQYEAALRLRPDYPEAWHSLAGLRLAQGRHDEVMRVCLRGLERIPDDPQLNHTAALAHFFQGRDAEARTYLDRSNRLAIARWDSQLDGHVRAQPRRWFARPGNTVELFTDTAGHPYGFESPRVLGACPWPLPALRYRQQRVYRVTLRNVFVEGLLGYIYDDEAVYANASVGLQGVWRLFTEAPRKHPRITMPVGKIVSVHQPNWENYYHWMAECLVRLVLLKEVLDADSEVRALVPAAKAPKFIQESLDLIGLDEARLIRDRAGPQQRYQASEITYVDWSPPLSELAAEELAALWYPPRAALQRVRRVLAEPHPPVQERTHVLYLCRSYPEQVRGIAQESTLVDGLRRIVGAGLVVFTGKEPLRQQVELFRHARIVIGPHGAGLTNLLFCAPGTSVVEFPIVPMRLNHYGHLAAALDLDYWLVPGLEAHYQGHYTITAENLAEVLSLVKRLLSEPQAADHSSSA